MCIATNGKIIKINDMNATIECKSNKINVRINPAIPVKVGDEVIVFRNIIIEKVL
jgi:hydrogenase maturation factor